MRTSDIEPSRFETSWLSAAITAALVTLFVFSTALTPIRSDNDCWWHVKSGQYICENGLPKYDVFSYTAADHEWHNHEWLSQVIFYQVFAVGEETALGGWRSLILFKAVIIWITVMAGYLLAWRLSLNWWIAFLIAVICVAVGRRMFYPRPPIITNLMLISQIWLLVAVWEGWIHKRWLFALPPFIALWTNLHGGWMAGGVIFASFIAGNAVAEFRNRLPALPFPAPAQLCTLTFLAPAGVMTLLATLANPYGYHLYALPGRVLGDRHLVSSIGELASPNFYFVIDFELIVLTTFALAFYLRFRPNIFELLIYFFFLHQAIQHVRHLSLFSIMLIPLSARLISEAVSQSQLTLSNHLTWPHWKRVPTLVTAILGLLLMSWVLVNPREGGRWTNPLTASSYPGRNLQYLLIEDGYIRSRFPADLADLIELSELEGRMWNENHYAGYLIWHLAPEDHLVFSDPRFDIFGGKIMRDEQEISLGNLPLLDEYDVQWLITQNTKVLSLILEYQSNDFVRAVSLRSGPQTWEIWIRDTEANQAMIERSRMQARLFGLAAP